MAYDVEIIKEETLDKEISSRKIVATSDHHMPGDRKDPKADFDEEKAKKFIWFQENYVGDDLHVINGDFFEGWQFEPENIIRENDDILRILRNANVVFTKGNHDAEVLETWGVWGETEKIALYPGQWTSNRRRVLIRHGHAADPNNREDMMWWGEFWTKFAGKFEEIGIPIDAAWSWFTGLGSNTPSQLDDKKFDEQKEIYISFARFLFEKFDCDCIVLGHTHRPSLETEEIAGKKRILANTGTWIKGQWGSDTDDTFIEVYKNSVKLGKVIKS